MWKTAGQQQNKRMELESNLYEEVKEEKKKAGFIKNKFNKTGFQLYNLQEEKYLTSVSNN